MVSNTVLRKSTPVPGVERIEPVVLFWKKLGLMPTTEVPDTARRSFAEKRDSCLHFINSTPQ
jgi:hypothetical protein